MDIITTTINSYNKLFASYLTQFLQWGEWLFYSCLTISIVWLCLWKAFDHHSFQEAMPGFIKEFFIVAFFYTIMINAGPWLYSIVNTATLMGTTLAQQKVDPSSIIAQGFAIANALMAAANNTSFLVNIFGTLIASFSYVIILLVFFTVALDLAITIISNSILISIASMSLAFSAFSFTRSVARKTLDSIITNSMKLLVLYLVIASGNELMVKIAGLIPTDKITTLDTFGWVVVSCLLFGAVAKYIPKNISKIFTDIIQEIQKPNKLVLSPSNPTPIISKSSNTSMDTISANIAQIRTAETNVNSAKFNDVKSTNFANSNLTYGNLFTHFKNIASKKNE
jgi:P-type conjugative transfer protein TrbL